MNKTLLLLALPLLPACLEPNRSNLGSDDDSGSSDGGTAPDGESAAETAAPDETGDDSAETTGDDPGTDESDESGTVEPSCDLETHTCVSNVPEGWTGPVARTSADASVACDQSFGQYSVQTYQEIIAAAASCMCDCGSPTGGECEDTLSFELYPIGLVFGEYINVLECEYMYDDEVQSVQAGSSWPYPASAAESDARVIGHQPGVAEAGGCTPSTEMGELPEPALTDVLQACEPTVDPESCDGETICVPKAEAPFDGGICIWAEGDVECPSGTDFVQREVRNAGIVDTRACTDCSCGSANGEACSDAAVVMSRTGADPVSVPADGLCTLAGLGTSAEWTAVSYDAGAPSGGSCDPQGGDPEGEVVPERQITFCCV